jgi:hypothetical protein
MRQALNTIILAVILLWPLMIGPEEVGRLGDGEPVTTKPPISGGKPFPLDAFDQDKIPQVDKEQFRISFKRQSDAELIPCLKEWRLGPASVLIIANLHRHGKLLQIRVVSSEEELPACARAAMEQMDFSHLTDKMRRAHVAMQWRIDW